MITVDPTAWTGRRETQSGHLIFPFPLFVLAWARRVALPVVLPALSIEWDADANGRLSVRVYAGWYGRRPIYQTGWLLIWR